MVACYLLFGCLAAVGWGDLVVGVGNDYCSGFVVW